MIAGGTVSLKDEASGRKVDAAGSVPTLYFLCFLLFVYSGGAFRRKLCWRVREPRRGGVTALSDVSAASQDKQGGQEDRLWAGKWTKKTVDEHNNENKK